MNTRALLIFSCLFLAGIASAQMPKLAVIGVDVQSEDFKGHNLTELLRIEFGRHGQFEIVDRYEVQETLDQQDISPLSCFSKTCLVKAGNVLGADKMASASIDRMGEALYIRVRLIDVNAEITEKEVVKQFLNLPDKIATMLAITVNELMGVPNDATLEASLTSKESYESAINNPHYNILKLDGPRMGYTFLTGDAAEIFQAPRSQGGYDGYPAMFQFGYQFERQYLNEGKFQALFEFIPMISGLDQGLFIPSFTLMNGLRNNVNGVEFALGPSLNIVKQSRQFQDGEGSWHRVSEVQAPADAEVIYRMDSRGSLAVKSYVVIAAGFSFRSGKMNIPVNAFVIPAKSGTRFGLSFGFNARG